MWETGVRFPAGEPDVAAWANYGGVSVGDLGRQNPTQIHLTPVLASGRPDSLTGTSRPFHTNYSRNFYTKEQKQSLYRGMLLLGVPSGG